LTGLSMSLMWGYEGGVFSSFLSLKGVRIKTQSISKFNYT